MPSVLFTLIAGVVVAVGVLPAIVLAGQSKGIDFVVSDSRWDIPVTGSPVKRAVHDRWPIDYCAAAREVPEDFSVGGVQCIHLP